MQFNVCPLDEIDFYKAGHYAQYPDRTVEIYSNFTPRSSRTDNKKIIVMGVQMLIQDIYENWQKNFFHLSYDDIKSKLATYQEFMDKTIYPDAVSTEHIMRIWELGYLPLEIRSIDEGSLVEVGVPILTIKSTHKHGYWLVNYLETKISNALWKPITSATTAFQYLRKFHDYANITGANKDFIQFQGHDFSYRGMSGNEDAVSSGLGHLSCFSGTDTVPAIKAAEYYGYGDWRKELIGCSVVATEHSVMCAGSKDGEFQTFERLLDKFPTNILSVVSDTWDYWQVILDYLPRLKDKIMSRDGRLVIRPDSGNPIDIICGTAWNTVDFTYSKDFESAKRNALDYFVDELRANTPHGECGEEWIDGLFLFEGKYYRIEIDVEWNRYDKRFYFIDGQDIRDCYEVKLSAQEKGSFECLWDVFGGTINDNGYKVLDPHIGMIYGDSITLERQSEILNRLKVKGFTADNLVLGIGSFTYEYVTRDTYGMAMKATNVVTEDENGNPTSQAIFKDPATQAGKGFSKKSAKGYLRVDKNDDGYILTDNLNTLEETRGGVLTPRFINGFILAPGRTTLSEIRERIKSHFN